MIYGMQPPGLFSISHLLFTVISLVIVSIIFLLNYKVSLDVIKKRIRYLGIFIILFEILKITLNCLVFHVDNDLINILPLYYCSLYIYFFIPTFFKNDKIYNIGFTLLKYYGLVPGICFTFYPITIVNYHPLYSFQAIHSLIFHSFMLATSLILLYKDARKITLKEFITYTIVTLSFCLFAYIFNCIAKTNYMFINYPSEENVVLVNMKKITGIFYPFAIAIFQTLGSLLISILLGLLFIRRRKKNDSI